jgi:predicted ATPase
MPLRIAGEVAVQIGPLALDGPAEELLVERVRAAYPSYVITDSNQEAIREICARLDGLPLALELVARRLVVLSPATLAAQLDSRLAATMDGRRDAPVRHRTMRGAITWSYEALSPDEQSLFARLSVLPGTFASQAAVAIASRPEPALDALTGLIDHSLVTAAESQDEPRFRLLEVLREFAAEHLPPSDRDSARVAILRELARWAPRAADGLIGPKQAESARRIDAEATNIEAALEWAVGLHEQAPAIAILADLRRYWEIRGRLTFARLSIQGLLASRPRLRPELRARALNALGTFCLLLGDYEAARPPLEQALRLRRRLADAAGSAQSLSNLALIHHWRREYPQMRVLLEQSIAESEKAGDTWGVAASLGNLAVACVESGEFHQAAELYEDVARRFRSLGDDASVAMAEDGLSDVLVLEGRLQEARVLLERDLAEARRIGHRDVESSAMINLASLLVVEGKPLEAEALAREAARRVADTGEHHRLIELIEILATCRQAEEQLEQAAMLLGAADGARRRLGWARSPLDGMAWHTRLITDIDRRLGRERAVAIFASTGDLDIARLLLDERDRRAKPPIQTASQ